MPTDVHEKYERLEMAIDRGDVFRSDYFCPHQTVLAIEAQRRVEASGCSCPHSSLPNSDAIAPDPSRASERIEAFTRQAERIVADYEAGVGVRSQAMGDDPFSAQRDDDFYSLTDTGADASKDKPQED